MKYSVHETRDNRLYKHGIQILGSMLDFHDARKWLIATYGISESIESDVALNEHWAFFIKFRHHMIYVRGDEELSWFKMKYGQEVE